MGHRNCFVWMSASHDTYTYTYVHSLFQKKSARRYWWQLVQLQCSDSFIRVKNLRLYDLNVTCKQWLYSWRGRLDLTSVVERIAFHACLALRAWIWSAKYRPLVLVQIYTGNIHSSGLPSSIFEVHNHEIHCTMVVECISYELAMLLFYGPSNITGLMWLTVLVCSLQIVFGKNLMSEKVIMWSL